MLKKNHLETIIVLCIFLFMVTAWFFRNDKFKNPNHVETEEVTNDILYLESQGRCWISNDTVYFVRKGAFTSKEFQILENLSYEKEVVIFSDLTNE